MKVPDAAGAMRSLPFGLEKKSTVRSEDSLSYPSEGISYTLGQCRSSIRICPTTNTVSAISTYRNQGTLKNGCDPGEHALVYNTGIDPKTCFLLGERDRGLYKEPSEVYPADSGSYLTRESRIRFGHVYSIEWNVKVKDIGRVVAPCLSTLTAHYDEENGKFEATTDYY